MKTDMKIAWYYLNIHLNELKRLFGDIVYRAHAVKEEVTLKQPARVE